ncbi:MAG: type IV pili methyl-accepting chemotaxis transducer N-terminal domain-containing protein [Pseudomonadota bacterium]
MSRYALAALLTSLSFGNAALSGDLTAQSDFKVYKVVSTFADDVGGAERIEAAELLRTYTQEAAAAACYLFNGIDPEIATALLLEARHGFDRRIDALLQGDESLGIIGPEPKRKTVVELEAIKADWREMAKAIDVLIDQPDSVEAIQVIKKANVPLFEKTQTLLAHLEGEYANPAELTQRHVVTLEIVGRQALMTQKIAKDSCKIFTGNNASEIKERLNSSINIYEASMEALISGYPPFGIPPAPTEEILNALKKVQTDWKNTRPLLEKLLAGEVASNDEKVFLFQHMEKEMHMLEKIAHAYVVHSKDH